MTKARAYIEGWNSAINACVCNPYGYDNNERSLHWDAGREAALVAFGIKSPNNGLQPTQEAGMTNETTAEIYKRIFGKPDPKFSAGEVAYVEKNDAFYKVVVLRDNGSSVDYRSEYLLSTAIAPHYGVGGSGGRLVKESEVPEGATKYEWFSDK